MKSITNIKGLLGGLVWINGVALFTVIGQSYNTSPSKYFSIVNVVLAVVYLFWAFKLDGLIKSSFNLVYYTIWFGLVYTVILELFTVLNFIWTFFYIAVSLITIYYLKKAQKELAAVVPSPPAPITNL